MSKLFKLNVHLGQTWNASLESVLNILRKPSFVTDETFQFTDYQPTFSTGSTLTFATTSIRASYLAIGQMVWVRVNVTGTTGGVANPFISFTLPFTVETSSNSPQIVPCYIEDGAGSNVGFMVLAYGSDLVQVRKVASANWGLGTGRIFACNFFYQRNV